MANHLSSLLKCVSFDNVLRCNWSCTDVLLVLLLLPLPASASCVSTYDSP